MQLSQNLQPESDLPSWAWGLLYSVPRFTLPELWWYHACAHTLTEADCSVSHKAHTVAGGFACGGGQRRRRRRWVPDGVGAVSVGRLAAVLRAGRLIRRARQRRRPALRCAYINAVLVVCICVRPRQEDQEESKFSINVGIFVCMQVCAALNCWGLKTSTCKGLMCLQMRLCWNDSPEGALIV